MKKLMYLTGICLAIVGLSGCVPSQPKLVNGKYYMSGDSSCKKYRVLSNTRIMCQDSKGKDTGSRDAMTDQQISMYQHKQQVNLQVAQQISYNNQQLRNQTNYNAQQARNRTNYNTQQMYNRTNYNTQQSYNRTNTYTVRPVYY